MNIIISNSSGEPIYEQITNQVKSAIMKGELSEGELLPSIRLLAKELQISVITTKRAYEELEREGFIETVPGKGSYVSSQNKELLKEKRLKELENKLIEVITESKLIGLTLLELEEMLRLLFNEDN
ncbi:GntR family transcriptional regulator [Clostridium sp. UBA4548]|uniref:GntR family transcriptional regulator n=1 Tax=Clostridium sp. UBA4548 TaxID=1946361 RepID=UPI0025C6B5BF|nr:GntR family transcriptional regulator [Clostridium sp. UBA4548]